MPIYEYKCENEHVFDIMQRMSDDPLTECVECGAPVRKVLHPVGISFKGSGFYSTDYSGAKSEAPAKGESSSKGESSKGDSKTDSSNGDSKNGSSKESKKSDSTSSTSSSSPKKD